MIPLLRPTADQQTKDDLIAVLESGWWGNGGKVKELEEKFAQMVGAKYAVATNSCTAALDLCIKAYEPKVGEALVTSPLTFVADAIVGEWNGLEVNFADINEDTLCLEPDEWDAKVIIAVNSHGRLADIRKIRQKNPNALIIEDCAHCVPDGVAGTRGDIAVWSFQAVKVVPAGDGGMVTTNNEEIAKKIRHMTWLGIEKTTYERAQGSKYTWQYEIKHGGTKSYMNDINAVLVLGGLRRLDEVLAKRMRIQKRYNDAFQGLKGVETPVWSNTCQYYTLKVDNRDEIGDKLAKAGIATSVHFMPLYLTEYWAKAKHKDLPVTDRVWKRLLTLPCHDALNEEQQDYIIKEFHEALR